MKISEIKFDFIPPLLRSNNSRIGFNDLLYIREREGEVKSYTVLKLQSFIYSNEHGEYNLTDEYGHTCTVARERIYLYRGQNLKIQRVYDIITQTISLVLISALFGLTKLFPELWEFLLG